MSDAHRLGRGGRAATPGLPVGQQASEVAVDDGGCDRCDGTLGGPVQTSGGRAPERFRDRRVLFARVRLAHDLTPRRCRTWGCRECCPRTVTCTLTPGVSRDEHPAMTLSFLSAPRGTLTYPLRSREGLEVTSLGSMAYLVSRPRGSRTNWLSSCMTTSS